MGRVERNSGRGARARVGSLEWTQKTRGLLSPRDRLEILRQALVYGLITVPAELRRGLKISRRRLARLDLSALEPPDSAIARESERIVNEMTPPTIVNHSFRTYAWGSILALHEGLHFDREVAYVGSLLHDVYFHTPDALEGRHCFTLPAANRALELGAKSGWTPTRSAAAADTITRHLNLLPPKNSSEAFAVFIGARLDIVGYRYEELHPDAVKAVLHRYPRLDLKAASAPMFHAQAAKNKGSRVHLYTRYLAGNRFIRRSPFKE